MNRRRLSEIRHLPDTPRHLRPVMLTPGLTSRAEAQALYRLARETPADQAIVEVGSFRGRSTVALALGSRAGHGAPVFAIDPHEDYQVNERTPHIGARDRAAFYRTMLRTRCWREVRLVNLPSVEAAAGWSRPVGLLWIDGDHTAEGVWADVSAWLPWLAYEAMVAFDDAEPGGGPDQAIGRLLALGLVDPQFSVGKVRVLRLTRCPAPAVWTPLQAAET